MQAKLFSQDGTTLGNIALPTNLFATKINPALVHLALVRQHANARISPAHALKRDEVRGSTRKILRQKGSGGARHGDKKSPTMRGGGAAWGPRNDRNFTKDMPKKMRRAALLSCLSEKAQKEKIVILESFVLAQPKTKEFEKLMTKIPVTRSLLVIHDRNESLVRSARNLKNVKPLYVGLLNVHDLTKYDQILFEKNALPIAEKIYVTPKKRESSPQTTKSTKSAGVV